MSRISCPFCGGDLRESLCLAHEMPVLHCCEKHLRSAYPPEYGGLDPHSISVLLGGSAFSLEEYEGVELIAKKGLINIYEMGDMDAYDVRAEPLSSILNYNPIIVSTYQATLKMRKALDSHKPILAGSSSKIVVSINGERELQTQNNYGVCPQKVNLDDEVETYHHLRRVIGVIGSRCHQIEHLVVLVFNTKFKSFAQKLAGSVSHDLRKQKVSLVFLNRGE